MPSARQQTDKQLEDMEKRLKELYSQAEKELKDKWEVFAKTQESKLKEAYNVLQEAKKGENWKEINKAKAEYEHIVRNATLNNERYKALVNETTERLANVNETATNYINNNMSKIYTINYNDFANQNLKGYSFTLMNEQALKNIARSDKTFLPQKQLNRTKDKHWNEKQINSQLFQGILQGESINKIANRLMHVTDMNRSAAIRNARTMVTAAENKGKQDACEKAQSDGVIIVRRWVATGDERTRDWHAELDGVEVGVEEPWVNTLPDGTEDELMYPGDPEADPSNTYNCRCTFVTEIQGFEWNEQQEEEESTEEVESVEEMESEYSEEENTEEISEETGDYAEQMQNSMGEAYEYHRTENNLNEVPYGEGAETIFDVRFTDMDNSLKEATVSQFEELSSKYDTTIQQFRPMDKMEYMANLDNFATTFHNYETDSSTIMYNPVKFTDLDRLRELKEKGYMPQIADELIDRYILTHEFAHTLIDMGTELNNKRNWVNANYDKVRSARKEIESLFTKYLTDVGGLENLKKQLESDFLINLNEESFKRAKELSLEIAEKKVSSYSMSNSDEFMAECFASYELGGKQNAYVDEMMSIINKYFGR